MKTPHPMNIMHEIEPFVGNICPSCPVTGPVTATHKKTLTAEGLRRIALRIESGSHLFEEGHGNGESEVVWSWQASTVFGR